MSSANDTPMTRFLFAILQQKCLKDIDWNKVAHDPILAQDITNGHAARMRYSRFRASMLGIEPQKRNRTTASKNRVTKSKKDGKIKKSKDGDCVKEDPGSPESGVQETTKLESPRVKQEMSQPPSDRTMLSSMYTSTSAPISAAHLQSQFQGRLLTPCSDSEALVGSSSYGASPSSDMLHTDASFDFTESSPCAHGHEQMTWNNSHTYSPFGVNFALNAYPPGPCDHQNSHMVGDQLGLDGQSQLANQDFGVQQHSQFVSEELRVNEAMMEPDDNHVMVKHEDWDRTGF
ncbi:hypothetical protein BR93DRAFT_928094 [Coniochaeta sp. PMI_546]|nr:hypothetical protein BR93DRAFT_928094 [Coniochaeta sp. PMI_546]